MAFGRARWLTKYLESKWPDFYRVAYSWTRDRDTAADLVQETVSRCLKHGGKFSSEADLRPWLYKVMANCWRDQLRKIRTTTDIDELALSADTDVEQQHYVNGLLVQVNMALSDLSAEQQEVLSLIVVDGLSYEEVSRALDIPIGTVMSRISRARSKLRGAMQHVDVTTSGKPFMWRVK